MKFVFVLRAIVEVVQSVPEDRKQKWPYSSGEGWHVRVRLSQTSAAVVQLMELVLEEKIRLRCAEHVERQQRLHNYFIDRIVDAAFAGRREEELQFLPSTAESRKARKTPMHELVHREFTEMGFEVERVRNLTLRIKW